MTRIINSKPQGIDMVKTFQNTVRDRDSEETLVTIHKTPVAQAVGRRVSNAETEGSTPAPDLSFHAVFYSLDQSTSRSSDLPLIT